MQPMTRRQVLLLGGAGTAAIAAGAAGVWWTQATRQGVSGGADFEQPPVLESANGSLDVELTAAPYTARIAGQEAFVLGYNGSLPGPTLVVAPGDQINLTLTNHLAAPTNLHVHGLHVSPQDNSDNVFVAVDPGEAFAYHYQLPADHPPGVYWYHPHHHGNVADQLFAGLYGAIIVQDPDPVVVTRERVLVISDISLTADGSVAGADPMDTMMGREGNLVMVNGQVNPTLQARPHQRERWRIINACTSRYLHLELDDQQLELLGIDAGRYPEPATVDEVVLTPGNRADVIVTASAGTSILRAVAVDRGGMGMMGGTGFGLASPGQAEVPLATFEVSGTPVQALDGVGQPSAPRDLRSETVTAKRELTFGMTMGMGGGMGMRHNTAASQSPGGSGMMDFTINGAVFDPARVDITAGAGTIEEWTLQNTSPMDHPVHLHVWPMQLIETQGTAVQEPAWQDVVNVPANSSVKMRIAFDTFVGKTVYHCHILDHEDLGMMGIIEVR
ncbi:multicopper oxidase family protein [Enteractinococcus coprophilus]|uniref:FtsP/CotA-like multicopper oxidase with cupredoxin domain n=1 Tax=Enteractinococcus coprophilus TaxID=1027633 RepID=A0A543AP63_9MICC|nr:multicopper oxidase family protein [Enteractinococcus coprophilus]TQL74367.1 FtsP/CotA-like multicopper oxidase with cupredoxin domain [Enteractinococcus coprophilus]